VNLADPLGLQADTTRHDRCEVAAILNDYTKAISENTGQFAAAFTGGVYPSQFDFKFDPPALYHVGDEWLRNDEFGDFAAGYAAERALGNLGHLAMRAGGIRYAAERDQHGKRNSGEHWDDRESVPMIEAGVDRADLASSPVGFSQVRGWPQHPNGTPLTSTAGSRSK